MFYGQIPLQKAIENQRIVSVGEYIIADFNTCRIAASFIKNYTELRFPVFPLSVLITNIHASVTERLCHEAKYHKLMPILKAYKQKSMLHEKNLIYCPILFVRVNHVWTKQNGYR